MSDEKKPVLLKDQIDALLVEQKSVAETRKKAHDEIDKKREELRKQILSGEGETGDRITDFVLGAYGEISEETTEKYRALEKELAWKKGQLFLVATRSRKQHAFSGCFGGGGSSEQDFHLETTKFIGLLTDERLVLVTKEEVVGLPTSEYYSFSSERDFDPSRKYSENFQFNFLRPLWNRGKQISAGSDTGSALDIFIGDEAVLDSYKQELLFSTQQGTGKKLLLRKIARLLGKDLPMLPKELEAREQEKNEVRDNLNTCRDEWRKTPKFEVKGHYSSDYSHRTMKLQILLESAKKLGMQNDPLVQLIESEIAKK